MFTMDLLQVTLFLAISNIYKVATAENEVKAFTGDTVALPCHLDTKLCGNLHSVKFYRETSRIYVYSKVGQVARAEGDATQRMKVEYIEDEKALLKINPVEIEDEATYKCEITYLEVLENCDVVQLIKLKTLVKPKDVRLLHNGQDLSGPYLGPYNEGRKVEVTCEAIGGRPIPDVKWYNGSTEIKCWTLIHILYMEVNINKYNPLKASSYVKLPTPIIHKRAVINVQNEDQACFAWAITSALCKPTGLPQRTSSYPRYSTVANFTQLRFPVSVLDIPIFEQNNSISINAYGLQARFENGIVVHDVVGPLHRTENEQDVHVNLLLVSDDKGNNHYCWIKSLSRLISSQLSRHDHEKYICTGCLVYFDEESKLKRHKIEDCKRVRAVLPSVEHKINKYGETVQENLLQFENFEKQLTVPFVIYADFEALLKPISVEDEMEFDYNKSFTAKCYEHEPYAFAYYIKCSYNDALSKFVIYRGDNAAVEFMRRLESDVQEIYVKYLGVTIPINPLSDQEKRIFEDATTCHICDKFLRAKDKVCEHDHLTGAFRGAAHSACNLQYKIPKFIPVFFHNLTNYDSHLFVKTMALKQEQVDVIAQNKEKYISFSKRVVVGDMIDSKGKYQKLFLKIRFLDSFRFMASSLEKLGSYLEDDHCRELKNYIKDNTKFKLLRQKGVFPYSFIDSFEKLDYPQLPTRDEFYDILSDQNIDEKSYERAECVWRTFDCKTLGDYADIYLTSDVLILADVFENFRDICMENYKLDAAQYFTAPCLSWDAMLRMTGVKLDLLTDVDMLHFFQHGIRGGVSMCTKRKEIANNPFLPSYDTTKATSYILYLDATNLYGHAMCQKLPIGSFRWFTENEINTLQLANMYDDLNVGYVLEVDLNYPNHLHDAHNDFPFCAENIAPLGSKNRKLLNTLSKKSKYIIHYLNLKQCLEHGLELTKIHRVLEFKQSNWLKRYIDFNTGKRNEGTNEFSRNFYKLMNNSIFGKTMENVENRVDIKLLTHFESRHRKLGAEVFIAKPNFKSSKIFSDSLVAVEMKVLQVHYKKPLYVGFSVLEISKNIMYDFYYNFLKDKYSDRICLLYTDTDSLIVSVKTDNVYNDMKNSLDKFDTSNYPESNIHHMPRTDSIIGKMKDEYGGRIIESFYGTGAKAYCVQVLADNINQGKDIKKAKGVKKYVIDKHLTVDDYKRIVNDGGRILKKMYVFRSHLHTVYTELKNKIALSAKDDKRYILDDNCNTLAWGHHQIENPAALLDELIDLFYKNN